MKELAPLEARRPRKPRLRKKLRVAEFQEFGFAIEVEIQSRDAAYTEILDEWIQFVEANSWEFGGGCTAGRLTGFLSRRGRGSLSEVEQETAKDWLKRKAWCDRVRIGELSDCWHGP